MLERRLGAGPNSSTGTELSPLDIDLARMGRTLAALHAAADGRGSPSVPELARTLMPALESDSEDEDQE